MASHRLHQGLLTDQIKVVVVGAGGTGSAVLSGLPYLHQSLLAFGHPHGLHVTVVDGDTVSETNCVRQPFSRSEVGLSKAAVLVTRLNLFFGLEWEAVHGYVGELPGQMRWGWPDLVIGCVDTRKARAAIERSFGDLRSYWLDFGNEERRDPDGRTESIGQVLLGEFSPRRADTVHVQDLGGGWTLQQVLEARRLPTIADEAPELLDETLDRDDGPSCSAVEALTRQAPFVNQVLAYHGLALLTQLFRRGEIDHHGMWVNLTTGRVAPIPVPDPHARLQKMESLGGGPEKPKLKRKRRQPA